jgi:hypothetical protein
MCLQSLDSEQKDGEEGADFESPDRTSQTEPSHSGCHYGSVTWGSVAWLTRDVGKPECIWKGETTSTREEVCCFSAAVAYIPVQSLAHMYILS